jgi:hypothetical protein
VITNQVQKWLLAHKGAGAQDGITVAEGLRLRDKREARAYVARSLPVKALISRTDHNADIVNSAPLRLLENDAKHGLLDTVSVH